ncbi:MAG: ABC transporter substrate-binding protein [Gammaproteobacteria bacterium]|nr:ABC transporter substrate-binding protein [Gammaproteobacteria bacterium]MBL6999082.1 ABC transporter substrate-binding protein [Gammaproteobacteria bacterium]
MTTALEGPAKGLGANIKLGIDTYLNHINRQGGVNGKQLELIALDDGYEPERAGTNMRKLIDEEKVVAVIGNVGTPTAVVTVPIANQHKTLLLGAVSGAGLLRKSPPDRYIINYRASYAEETAAMIEGLLKAGIKPTEIALFTQNDGYGDAGYNGAIAALKKHGFTDTQKIIQGRYKRNTLNVEDALSTILNSSTDPRAIIMVGAYKPCAKFIALAKQDLPQTLFLNVSFVGSIPLLQELGEQAEGVIVTQVVPHFESELAGVKQFRQHLAAFEPRLEPGFLSLEGYIVARILVEGVKRTTSLNRESIIDSLESMGSFELGLGSAQRLSTTEHQASHSVWPTRISGGHFVSFDWKDL